MGVIAHPAGLAQIPAVDADRSPLSFSSFVCPSLPCPALICSDRVRAFYPRKHWENRAFQPKNTRRIDHTYDAHSYGMADAASASSACRSTRASRSRRTSSAASAWSCEALTVTSAHLLG